MKHSVVEQILINKSTMLENNLAISDEYVQIKVILQENKKTHAHLYMNNVTKFRDFWLYFDDFQRESRFSVSTRIYYKFPFAAELNKSTKSIECKSIE